MAIKLGIANKSKKEYEELVEQLNNCKKKYEKSYEKIKNLEIEFENEKNRLFKTK